MRLDLASKHIEWGEGRRNKPYIDSVGKVTIGVGRNLDDRGLSDDEINYLKTNDIAIAVQDAKTFAWFDGLDDIRQVVIIDMLFNLGIGRFNGFKKAIKALSEGDYYKASEEMMDSKWYRQVGRRAERNVYMMRTGVWVGE